MYRILLIPFIVVGCKKPDIQIEIKVPLEGAWTGEITDCDGDLLSGPAWMTVTTVSGEVFASVIAVEPLSGGATGCSSGSFAVTSPSDAIVGTHDFECSGTSYSFEIDLFVTYGPQDERLANGSIVISSDSATNVCSLDLSSP